MCNRHVLYLRLHEVRSFCPNPFFFFGRKNKSSFLFGLSRGDDRKFTSPWNIMWCYCDISTGSDRLSLLYFPELDFFFCLSKIVESGKMMNLIKQMGNLRLILYWCLFTLENWFSDSIFCYFIFFLVLILIIIFVNFIGAYDEIIFHG